MAGWFRKAQVSSLVHIGFVCFGQECWGCKGKHFLGISSESEARCAPAVYAVNLTRQTWGGGQRPGLLHRLPSLSLRSTTPSSITCLQWLEWTFGRGWDWFSIPLSDSSDSSHGRSSALVKLLFLLLFYHFISEMSLNPIILHCILCILPMFINLI